MWIIATFRAKTQSVLQIYPPFQHSNVRLHHVIRKRLYPEINIRREWNRAALLTSSFKATRCCEPARKATLRVKYLTRPPVVQYRRQTTVANPFLGGLAEAAASYTGICISEYSSRHSRSSSFGSASSESSWEKDGDIQVSTKTNIYVCIFAKRFSFNGYLKLFKHIY